MLRTLRSRFGLVLPAVLGAVLIAVLVRAVAAGPLQPDSAPSPTDAVRLPGTPIDALPFTADQPGHYYVTRNLTTTVDNGIIITARNVSIDLGGFTLTGDPAAFSSGVVLTQAGSTRVTIFNGTIRNFQSGIFLANGSENRVHDVTLASNVTGIGLGSGSVVSDCIITKSQRAIQIFGAANEIRGCNINASEIAGIELTGAATSNTITDTSFFGNNTTADQFGGAIMAQQEAHNLSVRNSEFADNLVRDMNLEGDYPVIVNNVLSCPFSVEPQPTAAEPYVPVNTADPQTNRAHRAAC